MNRYSPHILVLPEDRANEEIANGFLENLNVNDRVIKIERPAGGWTKVISKFTDVHIAELRDDRSPRKMLLSPLLG